MKHVIYILAISLALTACSDSSGNKSMPDKDSMSSSIYYSNKLPLTVTSKVIQLAEPRKDCSKRKDINIPDNIQQIVKRNFPEYKVATLSDFYDEWCYFYEENEVPYYTEGDYKGNGKREYAIILTTPHRYKTLLVVIDNIKPIILDSFFYPTDTKNIDTSQTKFTYGLYTLNPGDFDDIISDSIFSIKTQSLMVNYFEKAAETYFWTGKNYKRIHSGD